MDRIRACAVRGRSMGVALGAAVLLMALGQAAEARVVNLRWSHPGAANVDGFRLHYGTSPGSYTTSVDIGRPASSGGVFSHDLAVGDTVTVHVVLSAYGGGFTESAFSNAKTFAAPTTTSPTAPTSPTSPLPPPPGGTAAWSQDFQSSSTGTFVSGWLDTGANNSLVESDALFRVLDLNGNRVMATDSALINIHSHYVASGADQWSSYGLQGRMHVTDAGAGIGVTAYSQYPAADIYYRLRRSSPGPFEISPHPDATPINCTPANTGVVPVANVWYRFRFEVLPVATGNSIRAKVWQEGATEPIGWQTSCVDANAGRPTRGTVGLWSMRSGQKAWDELTVYPLGGASNPPATPPASPPPPPLLLPGE